MTAYEIRLSLCRYYGRTGEYTATAPLDLHFSNFCFTLTPRNTVLLYKLINSSSVTHKKQRTESKVSLPSSQETDNFSYAKSHEHNLRHSSTFIYNKCKYYPLIYASVFPVAFLLHVSPLQCWKNLSSPHSCYIPAQIIKFGFMTSVTFGEERKSWAPQKVIFSRLFLLPSS